MTHQHDLYELRPYRDDEIGPALAEIRRSPILDFLRMAFPHSAPQVLLARMDGIETVAQFQKRVMAVGVSFIIKTTTDGATSNGLQHLDPDRCHTYISNHRDIVLDSTFLARATSRYFGETMQMAIGDNLIKTDWLTHLFRINKTVIVKRGLSKRALMDSSQELSSYISSLVKGHHDSFWIAQGEGRAKDGNDFTQSGVIKMLALAGGKDRLGHLRELDLVPVSISYEYDPCDLAKAVERLSVIRTGAYQKKVKEDLTNIALGLTGKKGRVHIEVGVLTGWDHILAANSRREGFERLLASLDREIIGNYRLWPSHYLACDLLSGRPDHEAHYSAEERSAFEARMAAQLAGNPDAADLRRLILEMYANPVYNKQKLA